jgi:hypothetical protein
MVVDVALVHALIRTYIHYTCLGFHLFQPHYTELDNVGEKERWIDVEKERRRAN